MRRIEPSFPRFRGPPRADDRRVIGGIIRRMAAGRDPHIAAAARRF